MTDTRKNTKISASVKKFARFYGLKKNERGLIDCGDKYKFVLESLKKRIVHINTLALMLVVDGLLLNVQYL